MNFKSSLDRLKKDLQLPSGEAVERGPIAMKPAFYDFDQFPEYKDFTTMEWYYAKENYVKNQFLKHAGTSGATVTLEGKSYINFSSYNYLALAQHPEVKDAAKKAIDEYGTSTGSGRSITGEIDIHQAFEREICEFSTRKMPSSRSVVTVRTPLPSVIYVASPILFFMMS